MCFTMWCCFKCPSLEFVRRFRVSLRRYSKGRSGPESRACSFEQEMTASRTISVTWIAIKNFGIVSASYISFRMFGVNVNVISLNTLHGRRIRVARVLRPSGCCSSHGTCLLGICWGGLHLWSEPFETPNRLPKCESNISMWANDCYSY